MGKISKTVTNDRSHVADPLRLMRRGTTDDVYRLVTCHDRAQKWSKKEKEGASKHSTFQKLPPNSWLEFTKGSDGSNRATCQEYHVSIRRGPPHSPENDTFPFFNVSNLRAHPSSSSVSLPQVHQS
ncbi:unnamed protein product [Citrullus colocynthis]|uniref:Uncharacterized protein n=1 Tax=Citrullus colocynthis TaxID=252529 RepID=A0ABP0YTF3_9ROSI